MIINSLFVVSRIAHSVVPPSVSSWHTECYKSLVSHFPLTLKPMYSLFSVVTVMMAELVVLGSVNLKPRRLSALRKWTVHGAS